MRLAYCTWHNSTAADGPVTRCDYAAGNGALDPCQMGSLTAIARNDAGDYNPLELDDAVRAVAAGTGLTDLTLVRTAILHALAALDR